MMNRVVSKKLVLSGGIGLAILLNTAFVGSTSLQAQMPSLPNLPGGLKMPSMGAGKTGFGGLDTLSAAKDLGIVATAVFGILGSLAGGGVEVSRCRVFDVGGRGGGPSVFMALYTIDLSRGARGLLTALLRFGFSLDGRSTDWPAKTCFASVQIGFIVNASHSNGCHPTALGSHLG